MYPDYNMYSPYFGFDDYSFRSVNQMMSNTYDDEIITLNQAIELIRKSVANEREDELFYDQLIKQAPNDEAKEIIKTIKDDEKKHNKILRDLYYNFTGQMLQPSMMPPQEQDTKDYKENLEKALFRRIRSCKEI